jgi:signal peptidase II|tara:strand:- start:1032 stop:1529 length:498 start_codon:yes stop_codon:yes gene_type:complete
MFIAKHKKLLLEIVTVLLIFLADRASKIYILRIAEVESVVDIYVNPYLNFYLIWNKGIAFGLFSFNESLIYNSVSLIIGLIIIAILILIIKTEDIKKYAFLLVLGGALGNLYDRIYYSAVPDFIDFHIREIHWFIFNVADIFITLGVIFLIVLELFDKKGRNEKN